VFGLYDRIYWQDSISGNALERVLGVISRHYDGTAWRGLMRRRALDVAGLMRRNPMDDFAADITWLARMAQAGPFRRIPEKLYRKRRRAESVSLRWGHWDETMRADAWCRHGCELLRDALIMPLTDDEKWRLVRAVLWRVLVIAPAFPFTFIHDLPEARQSTMVAAVLTEFRRHRDGL
jgi:hypothetical protein